MKSGVVGHTLMLAISEDSIDGVCFRKGFADQFSFINFLKCLIDGLEEDKPVSREHIVIILDNAPSYLTNYTLNEMHNMGPIFLLTRQIALNSI